MTDTTLKIIKASNGICETISNALFKCSSEVTRKYGISDAELTVAIVQASANLTAGAVTGLVYGPLRDDADYRANILRISERIQAIVNEEVGAKSDV
jgi:hypothetical protein